MKFTSELVKTAKKIYNENKANGLVCKANWRLRMSEAFKHSIRYAKACITNVINFFKLSSDSIECRSIDFCSKFTKYQNYDNGRFFCWDLDNNKIISFYPFQII